MDYLLPFYPLTTQKTKILIKWKKHQQILSFYKCEPYVKIIWCKVSEIWSAVAGRMDGLKKGNIEVGTPPKKENNFFFNRETKLFDATIRNNLNNNLPCFMRTVFFSCICTEIESNRYSYLKNFTSLICL